MAPAIYCGGFFLSLCLMLDSKNIYNVIGVMSGTSLDGIDLCYSEFSLNESDWSFSIKICETIVYDEYWAEKLSQANNYLDSILFDLDKEYTTFLAGVINDFIKKYKITNLDFISSHGHTVYHQPEKNYTFQLGNRIELRELIKKPIVCDFRVQDVALGGQGAPLVPIGDLLLFNDFSHCINLGGFSNISIKNDSGIVAYDICPVNVVLNYFSKKIGFGFDEDGNLAESGSINRQLLKELNQIEYYSEAPPKSLGIEWVEENIFKIIQKYKISNKDILSTYTEHICHQIALNIDSDQPTILFTGGGAKNRFLISRLSKKMKLKFDLPEIKIIDFKEALIFAFLGILKIRNEINCLRSVTGAEIDHSSGVYFE